MEHYVTLFDSMFLPQGLALHASMQRFCQPYALWILCMDDASHEVLQGLSLHNVCLLRLSELETPELLNVKGDRSLGEYCWTLTPFAPRFVFEASGPEVRRVTYIDADLWFRMPPTQIFREFEKSGKHVMITDHAYDPEYDQSITYGRFCVQFMIFDRDEGESVRTWWADRCVEWCHSYVEDGKFGDQKYLDDWPDRFPDDVHVLENRGLTLAPWNMTRFPHGSAVFFHFHSLRLLRRRKVLLAGMYRMPRAVMEHVYKPYLKDFSVALNLLQSHGWSAPVQDATSPVLRALRNILLVLSRWALGFAVQAKVCRLP